MYEFWYEYIKIKYGENEKLCYIDTDRFIVKCKKKIIFTKMLKQDLTLQILK